MGVIPYWKCEVADLDASWDGPAEVAAAEVADLRVMCAWFAGDGESKEDYKLPHHRASDHATVWAGVKAALAAVNGARGGVDLPAADRKAVYNHLRVHYSDFGQEAPEYRASQGSVQRVAVGQRVQLVESAPVGSRGMFEVVAIRPGVANGLTFGEGVLRRSVEHGLWERAAVFVDHVPMNQGRSVGDLAGVFAGVTWAGGVRGMLMCGGPRGRLVEELARELLADAVAGRPAPDVGLSADLYLRVGDGSVVSDIVKVNSLDVVFDPAAGGAFVRALNSVSVESGKMAEQVQETVQSVAPVPQAGVSPAELERLALVQCGHALAQGLSASGLPAPLQDVVRRRFDGRVFGAGDLEAAIVEQQGVMAGLMEAGVVRGVGQRSAGVVGSVRDEFDRVRLAVDRLFGLPVPDSASDVPRLSGLRELYLMLSGDHEFRGVFRPERVQFANANRTTMAGVVADALNKILVREYAVREKWWEPIVTNVDLDRYQDMKLIRPYGFAALATVAEGAAYAELTWDDVKETASIAKKGNYVGLTLEMIMSDDLQTVKGIPAALARAAWNALSDAVSYIFTQASGAGPTMADGLALFEAGTHVNLLTTALSDTQLGVVATAMAKQTEPGSSRRLGAWPRYVLVPVDLRATAIKIRNSNYVMGSGNNDVNPYFETFDVIAVPTWTDTTDWAAVLDPKVYPALYLGWLFGKREPEIFVADDEATGSMFTNDEMRIKARFFTCVGVADYRPLHKSNVT